MCLPSQIKAHPVEGRNIVKQITTVKRIRESAKPRAKIAGSLIAAALAVAGGITLSAMPANAASSASALYTNGAVTAGACTVSHTIHLNTSLLVYAVSNGCPWRVWLHETNNNRGYNICVNPAHGAATFEDVPNHTYANLWVSGNSTNCLRGFAQPDEVCQLLAGVS
jgi:hypothetical protein